MIKLNWTANGIGSHRDDSFNFQKSTKYYKPRKNKHIFFFSNRDQQNIYLPSFKMNKKSKIEHYGKVREATNFFFYKWSSVVMCKPCICGIEAGVLSDVSCYIKSTNDPFSIQSQHNPLQLTNLWNLACFESWMYKNASLPNLTVRFELTIMRQWWPCKIN